MNESSVLTAVRGFVGRIARSTDAKDVFEVIEEDNEMYIIKSPLTARDGAIYEKMGDICAEMRCFNTDMDEVPLKEKEIDKQCQ